MRRPTGLLREVNNGESPPSSKKEWGGTVGGPISGTGSSFSEASSGLREPHFTKTFLSRPEVNFGGSSEESAWNTCGASTIRSREAYVGIPLAEGDRSAVPSSRRRQETQTSYGDETDLDQTFVGTLTLVLTDTKVNTVRFGLVLE